VSSLRPITAVPALQARADIDESEHSLPLFEQNDILHGALGRFRRNLDLQCARQNRSQGLAVDEIDSARRCCGQRDATRRRGLLRRRHANGGQNRHHKR